MGKHKVFKNPDPIIKKDYKIQKRKKIRAQEKQQRRKIQQEEEKQKQELARIQYEVEQQIKKEALSKAMQNKHKTISKIPKGLLATGQKKKTEETKNTHSSTMPSKNKQYLQLKQQIQIDHYHQHYEELPQRINIIKWKQQSRKDQIDRQVRGEVRQMFSKKKQGDEGEIEKESEREDQEDENNHKNVENSIDVEYSNPYNLVKTKQPEKQVVLSQQSPHLFSFQAYQRKQKLSEMGDIRRSIINSYSDYIHIENKEEETIEQFRQIVIGHMVNHEKKCRLEASISKGWTNAKSVILCPYFGDAKSIIEILVSNYQGYTLSNQQKLQEVQDENDFFRIGISINDKKQTIKFFSHFNVSNFIIASPVGLKAIVGAQGQSHRDFSFLSSVQIVYVDRASTIYMQNWDHLVEVMKNMNLMPNPESICNSIDHLRPDIRDLQSRIYRQSILFSQFNIPEINGLKFLHFHNWEGCITTKVTYPPPQFSEKISNLQKQFFKLDLKEAREDFDLRFQFFKRKFWDQIHNNDSMNKIVIFVKSYFQFIRLKEFFSRVNASAECISEHSKKAKVQQRIHLFNTNKSRILLLSERAYYYGICQIKKLQNLYFYSLPTNSFIYHQLLSEVIKENSYTKNKILSIYTRFDLMSLERVVGSRKAHQMIKEFCSNVSFIL